MNGALFRKGQHRMSDIVERARARAHHHFLNTVTHDLFIELADEIERLRDGVQRIIDGTYGRDKHFKTKHDTCPHGQFSWQSCDPCVDEYLSSLIDLEPKL